MEALVAGSRTVDNGAVKRKLILSLSPALQVITMGCLGRDRRYSSTATKSSLVPQPSTTSAYGSIPNSVTPSSSSSLQALFCNIVVSGGGSLDDMEGSLRRHRLAVSPSLFIQLVDSFRNSVDCPAAATISSSRRLLRFFSWCRRQHEGFGDEAFNHVIRTLAEMKDITAVRAAISDLHEEGRKMNPKTFVLVIETLVNSGRPEEAVRLFRRVEEKRELLLSPSMDEGWSSVSAIVHALCAKGHARKAKGVLYHHKGKTSTDIARSLLLHGWCVHGDAREARRVLDQMKAEGQAPSLASYNDLLRCICMRNLRYNPSALVSDATNLITEMRSSSVHPTTANYNILLSCLSRTRRVKEACRVLHSMVRGEALCSPDWSSYYMVVRLLYLTGRFVRGNRMVERMSEEGMLVPGARFYRGLIGVLCGMDRMEYALEMFDRMKQSCEWRSIGPTYELLIDKLCRSGDFETGRRLWEEATQKGITLQCSLDLLDPTKTKVFQPPESLRK